jgi:pimeloyl-ACP methyl ester carboxylesterase
LARILAEHGFLVVIPQMPLNLAVLDAGRAAQVMEDFPEIESWAIGGHSLGGAMAANYAFRNPEKLDGLFMLAAYPPEGNDLSTHNLKVISIYGTRDGLAKPEKVLAAEALLPADTVFVPIPGGNHGQFGWYGEQAGDNPAQISREEQQSQTVEALLDFFKAMGW